MGLAQIYTDARNNNVYRVKKMLDNKCWMIDNLAYPGEDPTKPGFNNDGSPSNNTYGDTHTLTFATACGSNNYNTAVIRNCPSGPTSWPNNNNTRQVTTNNFTGSNLTDRVGNTIQNTEASLNDSGFNIAPCNNSPTGSSPMTSECLAYIYNWCSAIGLDSGTNPTCDEVREDSTTADSNGSTAGTTTNTNMAGTGIVGKPGGIGGESKGNSNAANQAGITTTNGSICPAGWRLPVGRVGDATSGINTYNEFAILNGVMFTVGQNLDPDATTGSSRPDNWYPAGSFSSIGSGYFSYSTGLWGQSNYGVYWGSSLGSSMYAAGMVIYSGNIAPGTSNNSKNAGFAVRCVLN